MNGERDTNRASTTGARLPTDPRYWDELGDRVLATAMGSEPRLAHREWWLPLSDFSRVLTAAAVVAIAAAWLIVGVVERSEPRAAVASALSPSDPTLARMLVADGPPPAEDLLNFSPTRAAP